MARVAAAPHQHDLYVQIPGRALVHLAIFGEARVGETTMPPMIPPRIAIFGETPMCVPRSLSLSLSLSLSNCTPIDIQGGAQSTTATANCVTAKENNSPWRFSSSEPGSCARVCGYPEKQAQKVMRRKVTRSLPYFFFPWNLPAGMHSADVSRISSYRGSSDQLPEGVQRPRAKPPT